MKNGSIDLRVTPYTGTYDGRQHNAVTVNVTPSDAKIEYSINGGTYSTTMPTVTNTSQQLQSRTRPRRTQQLQPPHRTLLIRSQQLQSRTQPLLLQEAVINLSVTIACNCQPADYLVI